MPLTNLRISIALCTFDGARYLERSYGELQPRHRCMQRRLIATELRGIADSSIGRGIVGRLPTRVRAFLRSR